MGKADILAAIENAEIRYRERELERMIDATATAPPFSEEALALEFAARHDDELRYVAARSRWFAWNGCRWKTDEKLQAFTLARRICREQADQCGNKKLAATLASNKTVAAVVTLARADSRVAAGDDEWDQDPDLLNTPNGVVDLRTGKMRDHRPGDYLTRMTAVGPGGDCPQFHRFLNRVMGGDEALQAYLQRVAGYCLTGSTKEHALFFAYGRGANGKSVLISTLTGIFGSYARTAPIETFTMTATPQHPTDLAMLRDVRCVTAVETEEGRRWAESRIKQLTGGDVITARFMRQDFFEYTPQFKLLIAGNHKPALRSVDEAIRRRFHLIPFGVTIPKEERDPELPALLKEEWPGILQWAIEGCLEWRRIGLAPPGAVIEATNAYLEEEDSFAAWLEECCERDIASWSSRGCLFSSWKSWAEKAGEHPGTMKRFLQNLEARGFHPAKTRAGRGFHGVRLILPDSFV